jgi:large subunit ribosomal protein L17
MSFINKPGKHSAWRQMVIRQQVSDVIAYGKITTTLIKAKESQRHVEWLITTAKKNTIAARRTAAGILLNTTAGTSQELVKKLFEKIAPTYKERHGGYTRVLKLGKRPSDNTEEAILELVK